MDWTMVTDWLISPGISILIIILVAAVLWFSIGWVLPPIIRNSTVRIKGESKRGLEKRSATLIGVLSQVARVLIFIIAIVMILSRLGANIGPILAGLGIVGVAVGFGAQWLIRDLIAGLFIIWENQFRVGDVARVADVSGLVEQITMRKTVLRDLDGIVHHIPNGEIRVASNFTRHFSRVNLNISVAYGTDLDTAIRIINRVGKELSEDAAWKDKFVTAPQVLRVDSLGDSGIDIKILGDVKPLEQWAVMGELRLRLKKTFDAEGIEIPWPHTKLYFGNSMPG